MNEEFEIVVAGCSYSCEHNQISVRAPGSKTYPELLKYKTNNISISGNSNDASIRQIYNYVTENNTTNKLFIFQITYLHRIGGYFSFSKHWINLQPMSIHYDIKKLKSIGKVKPKACNTNFKTLNKHDLHEWGYDSYYINKINDFYTLWTEIKYDEIREFNDLIFKIDLLKSFLEQRDNKLLCIFWPPIKDEYIKYFKKNNFFNIQGEYSMYDWSGKSKSKTEDDSHLTTGGHIRLARHLNNFIEKNEYKLQRLH